MKITIITVNLNNKTGLQKTINSIVSQSCKDFEWIVIDGGSTDGGKEIIEAYSKHISKWVSEPDKGIFDGMNKGIKIAKEDYLLFLNSGDILANNEVIENIYKDDLKEDIIIYDILLNDGKKELKKDLSNLKKFSIGSFLYSSTFPHQSTLIKRDLFHHVGLYDLKHRYVSDWIFFWKACIDYNASFIYKEGTILSIYDMSGISTQNKDKAKKERTDFLQNCYPPRINSIIKNNYKKEKEQLNLSRTFFNTLYRGLIWLSNKL